MCVIDVIEDYTGEILREYLIEDLSIDVFLGIFEKNTLDWISFEDQKKFSGLKSQGRPVSDDKGDVYWRIGEEHF